MRVEAGTKVGRYEVLHRLGAGGMGEVYLAKDLKLDRKVALKILPAEVAADADRMRRFVQEAKAASALNHPNIITIYEIDEADSFHFIAMEFIDGETLRVRMLRGPLNIRVVLEVATHVASALAAAHETGIVHRDIKPDNVMIRRDSIVKVLDFGVAKLAEQTTPDLIDPEAPTRAVVSTDPGVVMGTARYMSPEQARGHKVDSRTDIFSLGVSIYEMVSGRLPFDGSNGYEVIASILSDKEVTPVTRYSPTVPAELERIVAKTLRKQPDQRYQTAKDLLVDLKALQQQIDFEAKFEPSTPVPAPAGNASSVSQTLSEGPVSPTQPTVGLFEKVFKQHRLAAIISLVALLVVLAVIGLYLRTRNTKGAIESIVVLPFENQNHDPDTDYLSDGLTESIINSLTQLPNLKVIARSSAFRYKDRTTDPFAVANELGVGAVLTGRIMQRGDNLTVSAELLDVRDNKQLWGEQYNRKLSDLLSVQRDIASEITSNLRLRLNQAEAGRVTRQYTTDADAYQLYLKGRYFTGRATAQDLRKAINYFQQAIAKDPNNALAYTGLSDAYTALIFPVGAGAPREVMPAARDAAMRALAIDSTLSEAHSSLAYEAFFYEWNWSLAEQEFKRAIELNANNADAHHGYSHFLMAQHRIDESLAESRRALELSPVDLIINIHLGWHYLSAREYEQASEQLNKVVEMDRNFPGALTWLGLVYEQQKKYPEAISSLQKAKSLFPGGSTLAEAELAHAFAVSGNKTEALKILAGLTEEKEKYVSPYQIAAVYAGLGDKDQTFVWLEKAFAERSEMMVNLTTDARFDDVRSDPRFVSLVRRVGLT